MRRPGSSEAAQEGAGTFLSQPGCCHLGAAAGRSSGSGHWALGARKPDAAEDTAPGSGSSAHALRAPCPHSPVRGAGGKGPELSFGKSSCSFRTYIRFVVLFLSFCILRETGSPSVALLAWSLCSPQTRSNPPAASLGATRVGGNDNDSFIFTYLNNIFNNFVVCECVAMAHFESQRASCRSGFFSSSWGFQAWGKSLPA